MRPHRAACLAGWRRGNFHAALLSYPAGGLRQHAPPSCNFPQPTQPTPPSPSAGKFKVTLKDGAMGFVPCPAGTTIADITKPVYGSAAMGAQPACNSTDSYR